MELIWNCFRINRSWQKYKFLDHFCTIYYKHIPVSLFDVFLLKMIILLRWKACTKSSLTLQLYSGLILGSETHWCTIKREHLRHLSLSFSHLLLLNKVKYQMSLSYNTANKLLPARRAFGIHICSFGIHICSFEIHIYSRKNVCVKKGTRFSASRPDFFLAQSFMTSQKHVTSSSLGSYHNAKLLAVLQGVLAVVHQQNIVVTSKTLS